MFEVTANAAGLSNWTHASHAHSSRIGTIRGMHGKSPDHRTRKTGSGTGLDKSFEEFLQVNKQVQWLYFYNPSISTSQSHCPGASSLQSSKKQTTWTYTHCKKNVRYNTIQCHNRSSSYRHSAALTAPTRQAEHLKWAVEAKQCGT
jgi:hypothetical protein